MASSSIFRLVRDPSFRRHLGYVRRHWWMYVLAIFAQVIQTVAAVSMAEVLRRLFDAGLKVTATELAWAVVALLVIGAVQMLGVYLDAWFGSTLNETVVYAMRRETLDHIQHLPLAYHEKGHSSDNTNIVYRDLEVAKEFVVRDVQRLIALPISFAIAGAYLLRVHPLLALVAFCVGPLQLLSNLVSRRRFQEAVRLQREVSRDVFFTIGETLGGIREVKANQMEAQVDAQMKEIQVRGVVHNVTLSRLNALRAITRDAPRTLGTAAGIAVGATLVARGKVGVGDVVAFLTLLDRIASPFAVVVGVINNLQAAVEGCRRLYEVLDMPPERKDAGVPLGDAAPALAFRDVTFGYAADRAVLDGVSFELPAGKSLALVGPSGSGKSTLVKLLYRFYEPSRGTIELAGRALADYRLDSLRDRLALVSQDVFLFDAPIAANITAGRAGATPAEIERAADLAQASAFIRALPDGFNSEIGERGIKLSHGQKQRLSIARAVLRGASLLVLDEPTSALDVETEAGFQRDLGEWARPCTKIIIAHRLTTIRDCDLVLFLEDGKVAEYGTPEELLRRPDGRFRSYWERQSLGVAAL